MKWLPLARRVAALLLILCFFLPLSKCESQAKKGESVDVTVTYLYGHEMALAAGQSALEGKTADLPLLPALFAVFFLPVALLRLASKWQSLAHLIAAPLAAYCLHGWVFIWGQTPQVGGLLACTAWVVLVICGIATLIHAWLRRSHSASGHRPFSS